MAAPIGIKAIPPQVINEGAAYGPFKLKEFVNTPDGSPLKFSATLKGGESLPKGLICTEDGTFTGIPAKGTEGLYEVEIEAQNEEGVMTVPFVLTIKPSLGAGSKVEYFDKIKSQVWAALEQGLQAPDLGEMMEREITPLDIYYLLERWGALTIFDAFNLESPAEKKRLTLDDASPHYNIYDRGSCIVASPKDLFSYERTLEDGLRTARALAREAYRRSWTIELVGLEKFRRAAWIELQLLGDREGKRLEIVNYAPSVDDIKLYTDQAVVTSLRGKPE